MSTIHQDDGHDDLEAASHGLRRDHGSLQLGIAGGFAAAVLYTASNIALRKSVAVDPMLVAAVKAAPTVLALTPYLIWLRVQGEQAIPQKELARRFVLVALVGQVVGNGAFQVALGIIGLAASVPITLGTMLIGSAVLGRVLLNEPVRIRTAISIAILIVAVLVLSQSERVGDSEATATATSPAWLGVVCAMASGLAYALFSSKMRGAMRGGMTAASTMWISGVTGSLVLWCIALYRLESGWWGEIPASLWQSMALGGVFNFVAFVALSRSLAILPVVAVNLINASQVAMAAVSGVFFFAEPVTQILVIGISLTIAGLLVLVNRPSRIVER
ncbi:MAG: DMT family transporter [Planctomycetota bacterium]